MLDMALFFLYNNACFFIERGVIMSDNKILENALLNNEIDIIEYYMLLKNMNCESVTYYDGMPATKIK